MPLQRAPDGEERPHEGRAQRWRCRSCGASSVHRYDTDARDFERSLGWLLSKRGQLAVPGQGRSFRRMAERFWRIRLIPDVVDEVHCVVYVDGIYLARGLVVLVCSSVKVDTWGGGGGGTVNTFFPKGTAVVILNRIHPTLWSGQVILENYLGIFRPRRALSRMVPCILATSTSSGCCSRALCT